MNKTWLNDFYIGFNRISFWSDIQLLILLCYSAKNFRNYVFVFLFNGILLINIKNKLLDNKNIFLVIPWFACRSLTSHPLYFIVLFWKYRGVFFRAVNPKRINPPNLLTRIRISKLQFGRLWIVDFLFLNLSSIFRIFCNLLNDTAVGQT